LYHMDLPALSPTVELTLRRESKHPLPDESS